ncbi:SPS-sensor component SSY1 [Wickerhamiella sorbophila]|uniref:SPS-sensor component SSY1 n=1 Tax=Wickerhamiella sorbophila TaxID=45607 RepID=A0A2T0FCV7_9ASCO|nr:SPS-sensor component SSY1 [Wickerhamiella sorbophila]PRT52769.1 SPS-sensor component SSY1 [Wickerhamiella sorbophila]
MPPDAPWKNLFPEPGRIDQYEDSSVHIGSASEADFVEIIDDDVASSVCLDDQEVDVKLEDALEVVNQMAAKTQLTDYDEYNKKVAQDLIARSHLTHKRLFNAPDRIPHGYVELLGKGESDYNQDDVSARKGSIFSGHDVESLATLDLDFIDDPLFSMPRSGLRRDIRPRDFYMVVLGGYIGLAFFKDAAKGLWISGPVFTLLTFLMSGVMFYLMMGGLAEMVALVPHNAGYTGIINMIFDRSLATAFGFSYWLQSCLRVAYEVILTVSLFSFFPILNQPDHSSMVWLTFIVMLVVGVNFLYVRVWGRIMAFTAFISLLLIAVLNMFNLLLDTGHVGPLHNYIGATYWSYGTTDGISHGPLKTVFGQREIGGSTGRFLGFWMAWFVSAFGFTGADVIFVPTAEIRNPRRVVPGSMKILPYRIGIVFLLSLFIVLFVVNSGDGMLGSLTSYFEETVKTGSRCGIGVSEWKAFSGVTVKSVWIVAFLQQNVCYAAFAAAAFFIYIGVLAAAGHLFVASRVLHGLGQLGMVWRRVSTTTRNGVLIIAVSVSSLFALTAYITAGANAASYYTFLAEWVVTSIWLQWSVLCLTYYKFYRVVQNHPSLDRDSEEYPYRAPLQPYASIVCGCICLFLALFAGVPEMLARKGFHVLVFLGLYCPIFVFFAVFVLHKLYFKTKMIKNEDVNLDLYKNFMDRQEWEEDRVYTKSFRGTLWQAKAKAKSKWDRRIRPMLRKKLHSKES